MLPYEDFQKNKTMTHFSFLKKVTNENLRPEFKVPIKESFKNLIIQCWSEKPENRPSFEDIYNKLTSINNDVLDYKHEKNCILDDVDEDEILYYIEKIKTNSNIDDDIYRLKHDHQEEIDRLKQQFQEQINQIKKDHQIEVNQIERRHQDEINKMKTEISNQSKTIKNLQIQLNDIKKEKETEIKKLNDFIAKKSIPKVSLKNISIPYSKGNEFRGIISYFKNNTNFNNEINITSSSIYKNDPTYSPINVIKYHDLNAEFHSNDLKNS